MSSPIITSILTFFLIVSPSLSFTPKPRCGSCAGDAQLFSSNDCQNPIQGLYEEWENSDDSNYPLSCTRISGSNPLSLNKSESGNRCSLIVYSDPECKHFLDASSISQNGCANIKGGAQSWEILCTPRTEPFC